MSGYFSEKRGLKNIYEKLCLKYSKILEAFNIQSMNNSKEFINTSKLNMLTDDKNALFVHIIIFCIKSTKGDQFFMCSAFFDCLSVDNKNFICVLNG